VPGRLKELLADERVRILIADEQSELIGHVTFGSSRDEDAAAGVGEVRAFFVHPSAWRRGVGRSLMAAGLDGLRELGYEHATVWSFAANDRANAFYETHGFSRDGTTRTEEVWADLPEVRYRRDLTI
jgi:GNAT superfamily N-acetyltransferase